MGYIDVRHERVKEDLEALLDVNNDGKVDMKDVEWSYERIVEILQPQIPAGSGFGMGFVGGLRTG